MAQKSFKKLKFDIKQKTLFQTWKVQTVQPSTTQHDAPSNSDFTEESEVKNSPSKFAENKVTEAVVTAKPTVNKETRRFKPQWARDFSFIMYNYETKSMRCQLCIAAGCKNIWTIGDGCSRLKRDAIVKHMGTTDHRGAVIAETSRIDFNKSQIITLSKHETTICSVMKNVFFLAKKNQPSSAISDLNHLLRLQSCDNLQPLFHDGKTSYEHWDSITDMQAALATVVDEDLVKAIDQSPTFSVMIDESTDVSCEKTLIFYVRFVLRGQSCTRFLEVVELEGDMCTGENISKVVLNVLQAKGLPLDKLSSIATDGASVMTGSHQGVVTRLKQVIPYLISIHCIAHRLALASGQSADKDGYLKKYQAMVNNVYKYYHYSPKHQSTLERIGIVYNRVIKKFKQTFPTRWLSFEAAVEAILDNYDVLLSCLFQDADNDPVAKGLLKFVANYQFVAVSHYLADALAVLADLSRLFQRKNLEFTAIKSGVTSAIGTLQNLETQPGERMKIFLTNIPSDSCENFEYGESHHILTSSQSQRDLVKSTIKTFTFEIIKNLKSRFSDGDLVGQFSVLDPILLPKKTNTLFSTYGNKEMDQLIAHFNQFSESVMSQINSSKLKMEWWGFREVMHNHFSECTFVDMAEKLLNSDTLKSQFPNLSITVAIALCLPVSTADCERGFAKYNIVKTELRNRLKPESVSTLMKISVDTPDIKNMNTFNFKRAFQIWCSQKSRKLDNLT